MDDNGLLGGLGGALGAALVYIAKSWWDERQQLRREKRERERARELLADPKGPDDPKEAVKVARLEAQEASIIQQARRVRESMNPPLNGARSVPSLKLDIEEVKPDNDKE